MTPLRENIEVETTDYFMPYAPVVRVPSGSDLIYISGSTALPLYHQHPHEHDKLNPPEDIASQTRQVMENLTKCLRSVGASWADVVEADAFLTNMKDDFDTIVSVMAEYTGDAPVAASTWVEVTALVDPRLRLEMKLIAVVPSKKKGAPSPE